MSDTFDPITTSFIRGACTAIALFARRECSPRMALKEMNITREDAVRSGVAAFDLAELESHWPKADRTTGVENEAGL